MYNIWDHPIFECNVPASKEAIETLKNIIKSVIPWTEALSFGFVLFAISSLPPTYKKFQPKPQKNKDNQKWDIFSPTVPK